MFRPLETFAYLSVSATSEFTMRIRLYEIVAQLGPTSSA